MQVTSSRNWPEPIDEIEHGPAKRICKTNCVYWAWIKMQTGTVPVERLWTGLQWMFPTEATQLRMDWFNFLARIAYFRYNDRHFYCQSGPAWTEHDSLVGERLEDISANLFPWGVSG